MKRVNSKQRSVMFLYCDSPVTIDKSADWGENNVQEFPNGVWLKVEKDPKKGRFVSHGVQPTEDKSSPVGWQPNHEGLAGFEKLPIWVGDKVLAGTTVGLDTLDGHIDYKAKEDCYICYNGNETEPNLKDSWAQPESVLVQNYDFTPSE